MLKVIINRIKKIDFFYKGIIIISIIWNCILIASYIFNNPFGFSYFDYTCATNSSNIFINIIYYIGINIVLGPAVLFLFLIMIIGWIGSIFKKNIK